MPYIDIHVIQTLAPNNMNRDDSGAPKTVMVSGVQRQRLSSQSQKAAIRRRLEATMPAGVVGVRSRRLIEEVARRACHLDPARDPEELLTAATDIVLAALGDDGVAPSEKTGTATTLKTLAFLSHAQMDALAKLSLDVEPTRADERPKKPTAAERKAAQAADKQLAVKLSAALAAPNSVDQALFGRMLASNAKHSIGGAASVAHAISVDRAHIEYDYYTGVDDLRPEDTSGAGMIGTIEFIQSTVYRKADINIGLLAQNLKAEGAEHCDAGAAVAAFVHAFLTTLPTGKKTTFAHSSLPDLVMVSLREDMPVNLSGAFSVPVEAADGLSVAEVAGGRLAAKSEAIEKAFGLQPARTVSLSTNGVALPGRVDSITEMLDVIGEYVTGTLTR